MRNFIYIIGLIFLVSCIKPYDKEAGNSTLKALVVEGMITDGPGPYTIHLSTAKAYASDSDTREIGAKVYVADDLGNIYPFTEKHYGIYISDSASFVGRVGRQYTLHIHSKDGNEYKSNACTISNKINVDSIYIALENTLMSNQPDESGNYLYAKTYHVFTDINFMQAKNTRIDAIAITPIVTVDTFQCPLYAPILYKNPNDTSIIDSLGYIISGSYVCSENIHYSYTTELTNSLPVLKTNTSYKTGNYLEKIDMGHTQDLEPILIQINAYGISDLTLNFYYNLAKQLNYNSSSLFETIPIQLKGNITCLNDSSKITLGLFEADSKAYKRYGINGGSSDLPRVFDTTIYIDPPPTFMKRNKIKNTR